MFNFFLLDLTKIKKVIKLMDMKRPPSLFKVFLWIFIIYAIIVVIVAGVILTDKQPTVALLGRLQFAITTFFHFIFVPLTLGLSFLIAIFLSLASMTKNEEWADIARLFIKLFAINFVVGVATGIILEFEFGMGFSKYSRFVGDIFGAPLAIEALVAFFLESTFIGVLLFGWKVVPRWVHTLSAWLVAIGSNISALWILIANAWMQAPYGAKLVASKSRAELTNFADVVFNPIAQTKFIHTITAGYITAAVFVLAISAYHLLKGNKVQMFKKAAYVAIVFGLITSISQVFIGHSHMVEIALHQPTKIAASEALWETDPDGNPDWSIIAWADEKNMKNVLDIRIPGLLGWLMHGHNLKGGKELQKEFEKKFGKGDKYIPYVNLNYYATRIMVLLGFIFILLFTLGYVYYKKGTLETKTGFLKFAIYSLPLPYIAIWMGWILAEMGRQPFVVYPLKGEGKVFLKVKDAVSPITTSEFVITVLIFLVIFTILALIAFKLLAKYAEMSPSKETEAQA